MHVLSRPWRHRLLGAHLAAGAGFLGAGLALLAWSGGNPAGADAMITVFAGHLALVAAVLGVAAVIRSWHRRPSGADDAA